MYVYTQQQLSNRLSLRGRSHVQSLILDSLESLKGFAETEADHTFLNNQIQDRKAILADLRSQLESTWQATYTTDNLEGALCYFGLLPVERCDCNQCRK